MDQNRRCFPRVSLKGGVGVWNPKVRRAAVSLRGSGQSPALPSTCCGESMPPALRVEVVPLMPPHVAMCVRPNHATTPRGPRGHCAHLHGLRRCRVHLRGWRALLCGGRGCRARLRGRQGGSRRTVSVPLSGPGFFPPLFCRRFLPPFSPDSITIRAAFCGS